MERTSTLSISLTVATLACCAGYALAASPGATRRDEPHRISVTAISGDVSVTMAGEPANVSVDSTVGLPAHILTGNNGTLGLAQGRTSITIAADSDVEIPPEATDGQLIARLVQNRGNVFYDVEHRDVGRLRVETPFLVAIVKGTQFNVAAQPDSTTISLFQGQLEIRTPDDSNVIQLNAGEIALGSRVDGTIRVIGMNDNGVPVPTQPGRRAENPSPAADGLGAAVAADVASGASGATTTDAGLRSLTDAVAVSPSVTASLDATVGERLALSPKTTADTTGSTSVTLGGGASLPTNVATANVTTTANVAGSAATVSVGANLGTGSVSASVGTGASANLSTGSVSANVGTGVSLGSTTVAPTVSAAVDLSAVTSTPASGTTASVSLGASLPVAAGTTSTTTPTVSTPSVGVSLGVTASTGSTSTSLGTGAGLDSTPTAIPVAPAVDLSAVVSAAPPSTPTTGVSLGTTLTWHNGIHDSDDDAHGRHQSRTHGPDGTSTPTSGSTAAPVAPAPPAPPAPTLGGLVRRP